MLTIGPPDSATIGSTEYFLASDSTSATYQTTDCIMQAQIDFSAMAAGDQYEVRVYEKVDGTNQKLLFPVATLTGVQAEAFTTPAVIVGSGWEVSVKKIAGTDRSIKWAINKVTSA
jgi:hypothetical protein